MKCQAESVLPTILHHFLCHILPAVTFTPCTHNRRETWNMLRTACPVLLTLMRILSETRNDAGQTDDIIMRSKWTVPQKYLQELSTDCLMKVLHIWRNGSAVYLKQFLLNYKKQKGFGKELAYNIIMDKEKEIKLGILFYWLDSLYFKDTQCKCHQNSDFIMCNTEDRAISSNDFSMHLTSDFRGKLFITKSALMTDRKCQHILHCSFNPLIHR